MDKLAKDAAEARKAGMTYGKWMAQQEKSKNRALTEDMNPEEFSACERCGKLFKKRRGKRFCSDICRKEAERLRKESGGKANE